jgi:hypothetical protein
MIIKISKSHRLRGTDQQWQLEKRHPGPVTKRTTAWQPFKYYPTLAHAVQDAGEYDLRVSPSIVAAEKRLRALSGTVRAVLKDRLDELTDQAKAMAERDWR